MQLAYLHGEGILFSFVIHCFLALLGGVVLLYGLAKRPSLPGAAAAAGYVIATVTLALLSQSLGSTLLESIVWTLTLPWNRIVPCYGLDSSCKLTPGVSFVCAELNAAVLYFLVAWGFRRE